MLAAALTWFQHGRKPQPVPVEPKKVVLASTRPALAHKPHFQLMEDLTSDPTAKEEWVAVDRTEAEFTTYIKVLVEAVKKIDEYGEKPVNDMINMLISELGNVIVAKKLNHTVAAWQDILIDWAVKLNDAKLARAIFEHYQDICVTKEDIRQARLKLDLTYQQAVILHANQVLKTLSYVTHKEYPVPKEIEGCFYSQTTSGDRSRRLTTYYFPPDG